MTALEALKKLSERLSGMSREEIDKMLDKHVISEADEEFWEGFLEATGVIRKAKDEKSG